MSVFENNIKMPELIDGKLLCKCGSIRYSVDITEDDEGDYTWILISCKKCRNILFYNGA